MQWDFWTLSPESAHQVTVLDVGPGNAPDVPAHERVQQPHATPTINAAGARISGVKYHFKPWKGWMLHDGVAEADDRAEVPTSIAIDHRRSPCGNAPEWRSSTQVCRSKKRRLSVRPFRPDEGLATLGLRAHSGGPPCTRPAIPRISFFAEVEQAGSPANLVPGTGLSRTER